MIGSRTPAAKKVTYIFLSAARHKYRKNVLNTLYLPCGSANVYRFTLGQNLEAGITSEISRVRAHEAFIVYVDRLADGGYTYALIRAGKLLKHTTDGDRCFFHIELRDYEFGFSAGLSEWLTTNLPDLPKLNTNHDDVNDGNYVMVGDVLPEELIECRNDQAWTSACDHISSTRMFCDSEDYPIFLRAVLESDRTNSKDDTAERAIVVGRGRKLKCEVTSRLPDYSIRYKEIESTIQFNVSSGASILGTGEADLSGPADKYGLLIYNELLNTLPVAEISVHQSQASVGGKPVNLVLPDRPIKLEPQLGWFYVILVALLVVAYGFGQFLAAFGGFDWGGPIKLSAEQLEKYGKSLGASMSALAMVGLMWTLFRRVK